MEKDENEPQIVRATFLVYEGEIERDEDGNITNKLLQTMSYDREDPE